MKNLAAPGYRNICCIIFRSTKRTIFCSTAILAVLLLFSTSSFAQTALQKTNVVDTIKVEAGAEYYYWEESQYGAKILDITGPRYVLEISDKRVWPDNWLMTIHAKVYYGQVDYHGQFQNGAPVNTFVDYYGGEVDFGGGRRWISTKHEQNIDLVGRFCVEYWERTLTGTGGYTEDWLPLSVKFGVETSPTGYKGWTSALGVKMSLYTFEHADLSQYGIGSIDVNPAQRPAGYAELGYQYKHFSLTAYFDSYWFGRSGVDYNGNSLGIGVYQPNSWTYSAGLKAGWTF
jgi:hypothetical protein